MQWIWSTNRSEVVVFDSQIQFGRDLGVVVDTIALVSPNIRQVQKKLRGLKLFSEQIEVES